MSEKEKQEFSEMLRTAVDEVKDQEFLIRIPLGEEEGHETAEKHDRRTI